MSAIMIESPMVTRVWRRSSPCMKRNTATWSTRPKTSVTPLATRKYSAASVSPFIPVVRNSFGLSASPHTTNAAADTPTTSPQNHRQKSDTRRSGYRAAPACLRGPDFGLLVEHAVLHHRELDQDLAGVRL